MSVTQCLTCFLQVPEGCKYCNKCGQVKKIGDFNKQASKASGIRAFCRACTTQELKGWKQKRWELRHNPNDKLVNCSLGRHLPSRPDSPVRVLASRHMPPGWGLVC